MSSATSQPETGSTAAVKTPLYELHCQAGAKFVDFAGTMMPLHYPTGILTEHLHTRQQAGLFDVSHMGQFVLQATDYPTVARALESVVGADIAGLRPGQSRYTQLLNDSGTIIDDLMVTRPSGDIGEGRLNLVVNAARISVDERYLHARLGQQLSICCNNGAALLALQGPQAQAVLAHYLPEVAGLNFMHGQELTWRAASSSPVQLYVARSGYTGEDGFEISLPGESAQAFAQSLLQDPAVRLIGLGARDSLRLEAGLCLYGQDIDETTSPVEAGLAWSLSRRRLREGNFAGAERLLAEVNDGPQRKRVGLALTGRAIARAGTPIYAPDNAANQIGVVTSGGFSPSLQKPIAMGLVARGFAQSQTCLMLKLRGRMIEAKVCPMPFVAHRYQRRSLPQK